MSKLTAFLKPVETEERREVVVSNRFLDENGKPATFIIQSITQEKNQALIKASTKTTRDRSNPMGERMDSATYSRKLLLACVVEPDLADTELCHAYGVVDPALVAERMLLPGEYASLMREISAINRFEDSEVYDEAKNS